MLVISTCYGQVSDIKSRNVKFYIPLSQYKLLSLKTSSSSQVTENVTKAREASRKNTEDYILWNEYIRMSRTKMVDFVCNWNKEIATSPLFKNKFPSLWRYAMPHKQTPRLLLEQISLEKESPQ